MSQTAPPRPLLIFRAYQCCSFCYLPGSVPSEKASGPCHQPSAKCVLVSSQYGCFPLIEDHSQYWQQQEQLYHRKLVHPSAWQSYFPVLFQICLDPGLDQQFFPGKVCFYLLPSPHIRNSCYFQGLHVHCIRLQRQDKCYSFKKATTGCIPILSTSSFIDSDFKFLGQFRRYFWRPFRHALQR